PGPIPLARARRRSPLSSRRGPALPCRANLACARRRPPTNTNRTQPGRSRRGAISCENSGVKVASERGTNGRARSGAALGIGFALGLGHGVELPPLLIGFLDAAVDVKRELGLTHLIVIA